MAPLLCTNKNPTKQSQVTVIEGVQRDATWGRLGYGMAEVAEKIKTWSSIGAGKHTATADTMEIENREHREITMHELDWKIPHRLLDDGQGKTIRTYQTGAETQQRKMDAPGGKINEQIRKHITQPKWQIVQHAQERTNLTYMGTMAGMPPDIRPGKECIQGSMAGMPPNAINKKESIQGSMARMPPDVTPNEKMVLEGLMAGMPPIIEHKNLKDKYAGLQQPRLNKSNAPVTGKTKKRLRREARTRRHLEQAAQPLQQTQWITHNGSFVIPTPSRRAQKLTSKMCPSGLALDHPAGKRLEDWAKFGCPTKTGTPWSHYEIEEAIAHGPHKSARSAEAIAHFQAEIAEKTKLGQARTVLWDDIKNNYPLQLKVSPIAAIPHKSKAFRSILDLSFPIGLSDGTTRAPVNETTEKTAPQAAIDQLGHSLQRIIHAFAHAPDDAKIFMAKWDIKDGFWRLNCQAGEEWNFAYVLPQEHDKPTTLVIPTSLQMGWIESPPYFCAASETARDIAEQYSNTQIGSLPPHKAEEYVTGSSSYAMLPEHSTKPCAYKLEVFVDDFMSLVIATS